MVVQDDKSVKSEANKERGKLGKEKKKKEKARFCVFSGARRKQEGESQGEARGRPMLVKVLGGMKNLYSKKENE